MTKIINLTPHDVNVCFPNGVIKVFSASGSVARIETKSELTSKLLNIPIHRTIYGQTTGLPDYEYGVFYIVSKLVCLNNPTRADLLSPYDLVRDEQGNIIGCTGFEANI